MQKRNRFEFSTPLLTSFPFSPANYTSVIAIYQVCTVIGNSSHSLRQDCGIILISLKEASDGETKRRDFTSAFKAKVVFEVLRGESSQTEVCRRRNLSEEQVSKWKQQFLENATSLFESKDKPSKEERERIAELEQLVGRLSVAMDIQKKALTWLNENGLKNEE